MNAASASVPAAVTQVATETSLALVVRRHLRVGWISVLVFLTFGLALEALHGFKVQAYLSVMNETRRLMWTLAHAHGTLLGLANVAFAFTLASTASWGARPRMIASASLVGATVLMPGGFLLGGIWVYAGDPGLGIVLVPVGGVLLFTAVLLAVMSLKHFELDSLGRSKAVRAQNPKSR
jgi:hypothetical protein